MLFLERTLKWHYKIFGELQVKIFGTIPQILLKYAFDEKIFPIATDMDGLVIHNKSKTYFFYQFINIIITDNMV